MKTTFDLEEMKTGKYISSIDYKLILIKVLVRASVHSLTLESWFFFFGFEETLYPGKHIFMGPGERVKP